jgi:hypothetical protein
MEAFGIVVIVVTVVSAAVSVLFYVRADRLYRQIGRLGQLWLDEREEARRAAEGAEDEDLRQTIEAVAALRETKRLRHAQAPNAARREPGGA